MSIFTDIFGNNPLQSIARGAGAIGGTLATSSAVKKALDAIPTSPPDVTTPWGTATFSEQNNQITGEMSPELQKLFDRASALTEGIGPAPTTYEEDLALARGDFDTRTARAIERLRDEQTRQGRFGTEAGARELGELSRVIEQQEQQLQENVRDRRHNQRIELFGQATSGIDLQDRLLGRPLDVIREGTNASNQQLALAKEIAAAELAKGQGINNIIDGLLGGTGKDSLFGGFNVGSLLDKILGTGGDAISKGSTLFDAADQIELMRTAAEAAGLGSRTRGADQIELMRAAAEAAGGSPLSGTTTRVVDTMANVDGTPLSPTALRSLYTQTPGAIPSYGPKGSGMGGLTPPPGGGGTGGFSAGNQPGTGLFDSLKGFDKMLSDSLLKGFTSSGPAGAVGYGFGPGGAATFGAPGAATVAGAGAVPGGASLMGTFGGALAAYMAIQAAIALTDNMYTMEDAVDAAKAYDPRILDLKAGKKVEPTGKHPAPDDPSIGDLPKLLRALELIGRAPPAEKAKAIESGVLPELVKSAHKVKRVEGPRGGYWYEVPEAVEEYLENENPDTKRIHAGIIRSSKTKKPVALPTPSNPLQEQRGQ